MTIVSIDKIANGGDGIGHLPDGRVVFVARAIPGDTVEIELTRSKKRWARGRVLRVIEPSADRTASGCAHFDVCGGCAFQQMRYDAELRAKAAAARDAFARISGLSDPVAGDDVAASAVTGYRIRTRWHAKDGAFGYFKAGSHAPFALRECPVLHPRLAEVARDIAPLLGDEPTTIAAEIAGEKVVVQGSLRLDVAEKIAALEQVAGVQLDQQALGDVAIGSADAWGIDVATTLGAGRFRQSNGPMTATLRDLVLAQIGRGAQLVEYFAGSGSFTHHAAKRFDAVTAYELDPVAVSTGNEVAAELGAAATRFVCADLDREAPPPPAGATVLLDPPRAGAAALCAMLAASEASRIVYVSCDIGTLARDAKALTETTFKLHRLDLVDMFPRTAHIEAIAVFEREAALHERQL